MKIRIWTLIVAICVGATAMADMTTKIRSIELSSRNLQVPTSPNGRLNFKPCSSNCKAKYQSSRLSPETRYSVNNDDTDFLGFRQAFFNMARDKDHYVLISYDAKSNTVISVQIAN